MTFPNGSARRLVVALIIYIYIYIYISSLGKSIVYMLDSDWLSWGDGKRIYTNILKLYVHFALVLEQLTAD